MKDRRLGCKTGAEFLFCAFPSNIFVVVLIPGFLIAANSSVK
jgi:uncharacterized membrane protein